ncbi:MAG TPA: cytochrome C, partial [Pseudorhizobium sp.]|nr:cytochrome C [Pseudorhizobium sp.]
MKIRWRHALIGLIGAPVMALLIGWSGLIGVGASSGHWAITDWFLHWVMRNSVRTAALSVSAPPLDDPALLPPAAGHYEIGCA